MKKVLVALVLIALLFTLCACAVPHNSFMSSAQVNSLVKRYGKNPQAELTLTYDLGSESQGNLTTVEVKVTYNLLLEQTPIAVTRFIQLANEGHYDNSVVDYLNTTYNYLIMGRYRADASDSTRYYENKSDVTFAGEFESNKYSQPKDGYAQFSIFSLAMFHEDTDDDSSFNEADGTLILALSNDTLNSANYAVFAQFESMVVSYNGVERPRRNNVAPDVLSNLRGFAARNSHRVYESESADSTYTSITWMSQKVTLTVKILGDYDWSKLPVIR